jgi:uncharacterized alpha-E superfamily protein
MISRVAEHCFWMSRYLERAENTARILEVNQTLLLDFYVPLEHQWQPLLIISGIHHLPGEVDAETVQNYLTWEASNLSSIASAISAARENARIIREVISAEMWERLNYYYLWMQGGVARHLYEHHRSEFYNQIKRINQLFQGICDSTMAHGEAWEFLQLGKWLERACQTARILDVKYHVLLPTPEDVGTPVDNAHWSAILTSCSAYEPFHKQRDTSDPGVAVPHFLVFDPAFPRSVRHCLLECRSAAHAISGRPLSLPGNEVEHALLALVGWLHLNNASDFVAAGLHEALTNVIDRIHEIGDAIHRTYFDVRFQAPSIPDPAAGELPSGSG